MKVLAVLIIAALFGAVLLVTGQAHATTVERVVATQPASCNGQRCVQLRTITLYAHGQDTLTITKRRTAPAEARTPTSVIPWRSGHVIAASTTPCCSR
jgi:hypothetical protein